MMFSMDEKLKNKHTSNFQCDNVWLIQFCSSNVLFMGNIYFFECDEQERQCWSPQYNLNNILTETAGNIHLNNNNRLPALNPFLSKGFPIDE